MRRTVVCGSRNASDMVYLNRRMFYRKYSLLPSKICRFLSFEVARFAAVLAFVTVILVNTGIRSAESKSRKWNYSCASCSSVGVTVTCKGDGAITQAMVQQAGVYTKYEVARIEWGITRIERQSFYRCSKLTDITIAESVVYIGGEAFGGMGAITSITFPSSVTEIHGMAVNVCNNLVNVSMAFQNGTYTSENGMIMLTKDGYKGIHIVGAGRCKGTTLEIPSVDKIWSGAFRWNLATVMKVPDSVIEIQADAFYMCRSMHTLQIGKGLQTMNKNALGSCTALSTVILDSRNSYFYHKTETGGQIFGKKKSGTSDPQSILWISITSNAITIPGTVTEIGGTVLQSCPNLTSVTVESTSTSFSVQCGGLVVCSKDGSSGKFGVGGAVDIVVNKAVKFLEGSCCRSMSRLQTVTFHSEMVGCSGNCFRDSSVLHTVDFGSCTMRAGTGSDAVHQLSSHMFHGCSSLKTILNWPTNSFVIAELAFALCALEELVLPQSVIQISNQAFESCSKLRTISFPKTLTSIDWNAFKSCSSLRTVSFQDGSTLNQINFHAMAYCTQLETITLPDSLTVLDNGCFVGDTMLTSIKFEENSGVYRSDGVSVYKDGYETLYLCSPGLSSVTLHQNTRVITTRAFYSCNNLVHVDLSDSVERIEESAFLECTAIKSVRLQKNLAFIGSQAFSTCSSLRDIFYCNDKNSVQCGENPFQAKASIYVFYDFTDQTFCGHSCSAILDHQCNIPTNSFTGVSVLTQPRFRITVVVYTAAYRLLVM